MSRPIFNWIIVYNDGTTEIVQGDDIDDASTYADYTKDVLAIIKRDFS